MKAFYSICVGLLCSSIAFGQYVHTEMVMNTNDYCVSIPTNRIDSVTFDIQGDSTYLTLWLSGVAVDVDTTPVTAVLELSSLQNPTIIQIPLEWYSLNSANIDSITYTSTLISSTPGTGVTDIDGNSYGTTVIGNGQEWMTENLRTSRYANGDWLESTTSTPDFYNSQVGAWCHFENDFGYENTHGKLYNWYAVDDVRNVCPDGWHVPDTADFFNLFRYISPENCSEFTMHPNAFGNWLWIDNVEALIKENSLWNYYIAHNAYDATGFSALGTGRLSGGNFDREFTEYWSSTSYVGESVFKLLLTTNYVSASNFWSQYYTGGAYIRCIKDQ